MSLNFRVLTKLFTPNNDKVDEQIRIVHNNDLLGLYSSPSFVGRVKYRRPR
jgi:hypothetical protein